MAPGSNWTRYEHLIALRVYLAIPFGRLDQKTPEIIDVARAIGRTPSAVAMKTSQFANLDPDLDRKGLSNTSAADRRIWAEFEANPEQIAFEAETVAESLQLTNASPASSGATPGPAAQQPQRTSPGPTPPAGPTEADAIVRVRRVQSFFRASILTSYESRCAMTGLSIPSLLLASHIIPWSDDVARRADPRNGLCLSALFDRAFDRGLITFDEQLRLVLSPVLKDHLPQPRLPCLLTAAEGKPLNLPVRLTPDPAALAYHREAVFVR